MTDKTVKLREARTQETLRVSARVGNQFLRNWLQNVPWKLHTEMNWWNYSILKERITIKTSEKQNKPIVDEHQQSSLIQYDEYNAIYSSTERENPDFSRRGVVAKRGYCLQEPRKSGADDDEIKQKRAQGGCLGTKSRRKTW